MAHDQRDQYKYTRQEPLYTQDTSGFNYNGFQRIEDYQNQMSGTFHQKNYSPNPSYQPHNQFSSAPYPIDNSFPGQEVPYPVHDPVPFPIPSQEGFHQVPQPNLYLNRSSVNNERNNIHASLFDPDDNPTSPQYSSFSHAAPFPQQFSSEPSYHQPNQQYQNGQDARNTIYEEGYSNPQFKNTHETSRPAWKQDIPGLYPMNNAYQNRRPTLHNRTDSSTSDGLHYSPSVSKPLGPRQAPASFTSSVEPQINNNNFVHKESYDDSPIMSPMSASTSFYSTQDVPIYSSPKSPSYSQSPPKLKKKPPPSYPKTEPEQVGDVSVEVIESLGHLVSFIEKKDNKTVMLQNKHKLRELRYSQSQLIKTTTDLPKIKPLVKNSTWSDATAVTLDLPSLPYSSSSLTTAQLKLCTELWSLSKVLQWCQQLKVWFAGACISREELSRSILALIHHRYSKLTTNLIEDNVDTMIDEFEKSGCILFEGTTAKDKYVVFHENATISGVMPELSSCYSTRFNHRKANSNLAVIKGHSCYARHCPREASRRTSSIHTAPSKRVITTATGLRPDGKTELGDDWHSHWNFTAEELGEIDYATQQRQLHLFDLIKGEQRIVNQGRIILEVYGESFRHQKPPLLPDIDYYSDAFAVVVPLVDIHKRYLLEPLIAKVKHSKFLTGVADLYLKWAREVYIHYLKYVASMVTVDDICSTEKEKYNSKFDAWVDKMDSDERVTMFRVDYTRLRLVFVTSAMNLPITLKEVRKYTPETDPEHKRLTKLITIWEKLVKQFDSMRLRADNNLSLKKLSASLLWKSGTQANLEWESLDRKICKIGPVTKKREMWINGDCQLILLDNYLLITDMLKEGTMKYKVTERPIAMRFLYVEIDSAYRQATVVDRVGKTKSEAESQESVVYPFKIKNVGIEQSFTFYVDSEEARDSWLSAIVDAQNEHYKAHRKSEPYRLKVISDAAFAYDFHTAVESMPVCPDNSPVGCALKESDEKLPGPIPNPLMNSKVSCAQTFTYKEKEYLLVGLGFGVYISGADETRNWKQVLNLRNVTQLEVLEEFNLLFALADRTLQYYTLDSIFSVLKLDSEQKNACGHKLSNQYVGFFNVGHQGDSVLLFYSRHKISSSACHFKVLLPTYDSASDRFDYFTTFLKFVIPAECYWITILNSSLIVHTIKGFESMQLPQCNPQTIPNWGEVGVLHADTMDVIKKKLKVAKPLGFYKINDNTELLLVYNEFAIICGKLATLSRLGLLQFSFRCTKVAFQDEHLVIVGKNVIEIFKIDGNTCMPGHVTRPIQVINGKNIQLIDTSARKLKFAMSHPNVHARQLLLQMIPNEYYSGD